MTLKLDFFPLKKPTDNFYIFLSLFLSIIAYTSLLFYPLYPYFEKSIIFTIKNFAKSAKFHTKIAFFFYSISSISLLQNFCMAVLLETTRFSALTVFWDNLTLTSKFAFFSSLFFILSYPIVTLLGLSSSLIISSTLNHLREDIILKAKG